MQTVLPWLVFLAASFLEVGGDALIRKGLRSSGWTLIVAGCLALGAYGLVVNLVRWDFSKLLGVYVAVFAATSILVGRFFFKEHIPMHTWAGLVVIAIGGLVIQFGQRFRS